ncbi:MAG: hypothetical protein HQK62_01490 [Desulfamplus sp.]|nr:hypothetical protein [Desulfamplus sp.]
MDQKIFNPLPTTALHVKDDPTNDRMFKDVCFKKMVDASPAGNLCFG